MATATKDALLTGAVELARQVAVEAAERPAHVGEHLGVVVEGDRLVSHRFASTAPGYRGWSWTVTLARAPRARVATICEVGLLPGDDAVLAPAWLPWSERLLPGDVSSGDVLPFLRDDPRLVPGYLPTGDDEQDRVAFDDLALARARLLSREGRDRVAERWYAGSQGPTSPGAVAASAPCLTCAFMVGLSGPLGQVFGVCSNEWSPDEGRVISADHGCGAHSETDIDPHASDWPAPGAVFDDLDVELVSLIAEQPAAIENAPELAADGIAEPEPEPEPELAADGIAEPAPELAADGIAEPEPEPAEPPVVPESPAAPAPPEP